MGLFERIFRRPVPRGRPDGQWSTLTAYAPIFTSWGGNIYGNDLIRAAIDAVARHCSKLTININGSAKPGLRARLLKAPNEWQTWAQFLYRLSTILDVQCAAFIVPVIGEYGEITGIYPILPSMSELVSYNGEPYIRYSFTNGDTAAISLYEVGIMTRFQYTDDFMGEGNGALDMTMQLIMMQNQGITEAVKNSNTFRFMARVGNMVKPGDVAKERARFNRENLENGGGGLLLFPKQYEDIHQITSTSYTVNADQMKQIQSSVFDYFGVNEEVLQNRAIGDAWSAFYEGRIEPFAIQLSEVLTRMLYTMRERGQGNEVYFSSNRLQYMSNADKLNVTSGMADRGLMTRNELREIWNLPPLPEPLGSQIPARGEYYDVVAGHDDGNGDDTNDGTD